MKQKQNMNTQPDDLLFEIGTEELPPHSVLPLATALAQGLHRGLTDLHLPVGPYTTYATPRRLAVLMESVGDAQPDYGVERKGPAIASAFDKDGNPTPAALGFARSCGTTIENLEKRETPEGAWLFFKKSERGKPLSELLPPLLKKILQGLPIPKRMRWGSRPESFVRPVHWLLLLHGNSLIPLELFNIKSAQFTFGHRFHAPGPFLISHPRAYEQTLEEKGAVIPSFTKRRARIAEQLAATEKLIPPFGKGGLGGILVEQDSALLDEVTSLVEWPSALTARFDKRFLKIPPEILISSMKHHQRCFPVTSPQGKLLPFFVIVSNNPSKQSKSIVKGNERVMQARLSDAEFFYQNDLKKSLETRLESLKSVLFQEKLGNLYEKSLRIATLAKKIAEHTHKADPTIAFEAGKLAKADLISEIVKEFPELQGTMGAYCAKNDGLPEKLATAIAEHYLPRTSGDVLPTSPEGVCVAIADRLDTLVGIFGIGLIPTGDKDPYGLRRAALAILRMVLEKNWPLDLKIFIEEAVALYAKPFPIPAGILDVPSPNLMATSRVDKASIASGPPISSVSTVDRSPAKNAGSLCPPYNLEKILLDFILERLRAWYADRQVPTNLVNAVLAKRPSDPIDFDARIEALREFSKLPEAAPLAAAHKRINNILNKTGQETFGSVSTELLQEPAEKELAEKLCALQETCAQWAQKKDYSKILSALANIKEPVDRFFDAVLVMAEDPRIRGNRLALLAQLRMLFTLTAEIELLSPPLKKQL